MSNVQYVASGRVSTARRSMANSSGDPWIMVRGDPSQSWAIYGAAAWDSNRRTCLGRHGATTTMGRL